MDYIYFLNSLLFGCLQVFFGLFTPLLALSVVSFIFFAICYGPPVTFSESHNKQLYEQFKKDFQWRKLSTWSSWPAGATITYLSFLAFLTAWGILLSVLHIDSALKDPNSVYAAGKTRLSQSKDEYDVKRDREDDKEIEVIVSTKIQRFTIVGINPPKHFYVDLKTETGHVYESTYVSKHCNNLPKLHDEYNISITTFYTKDNPSNLKVRFNNLYSTLCGG